MLFRITNEYQNIKLKLDCLNFAIQLKPKQ